jgi:iron complex transport system substrate-binding protein
VVGVTRFCNYPPEAKKKTIVGDANISVEKVIALKPDLVLAHETLNDTAVRALEARRVRVVTVNSKTIDQVIRDMLLVGRITNKEREASKVAKRISSARSLVRQKVSGISKKPKVLVAIQANPLWVAGPSTFVNEMIVDAGGVNIASNAKPGFTQFSAEIAVAKKPDVIIATTKGDKQVFTRGVWKRTPAVHNGCVYEVNADLIVRPGPRLADGIMLIARLLHPDVFKKR